MKKTSQNVKVAAFTSTGRPVNRIASIIARGFLNDSNQMLSLPRARAGSGTHVHRSFNVQAARRKVVCQLL